jgi:integrase
MMARGGIYPYKLRSGGKRWMVKFRTSNGVQKLKRGFKGPREAEAFLNQMVAAVDRGNVIASKDTFAEYIDLWLEEHRPRLEPGTYDDYRSHIEGRLKPFFGEMKLSSITPGDVRRFVAELVRGTEMRPSSRSASLERARAASERLHEFTVAELERALDVSRNSARYLIARLEREGTVERARRRRRATRGRPHQLYRFGGPHEGIGPGAPERIANKTINNSVMVLRLALGHAEEDGLIARNPAASRPGARNRIMLPAEHREMDYLRLYEIPPYLDACSPVYYPLAELLIACGLRISEALALTFRDVDFDAGTLRVLRSGKGRGTGSTKGDRFRSVDFGPRIDSILRDLQARRTEHGSCDPSALVFLDENSAALERRYVSGVEHKGALGRAELRRSLRLHDLRHTAAASWLACGLPLIYVQRQLGHASVNTTERAYGHLEENYLRGAAERVERAIWEGRTAEPSIAAIARSWQMKGAGQE